MQWKTARAYAVVAMQQMVQSTPNRFCLNACYAFLRILSICGHSEHETFVVRVCIPAREILCKKIIISLRSSNGSAHHSALVVSQKVVAAPCFFLLQEQCIVNFHFFLSPHSQSNSSVTHYNGIHKTWRNVYLPVRLLLCSNAHSFKQINMGKQENR